MLSNLGYDFLGLLPVAGTHLCLVRVLGTLGSLTSLYLTELNSLPLSLYLHIMHLYDSNA